MIADPGRCILKGACAIVRFVSNPILSMKERYIAKTSVKGSMTGEQEKDRRRRTIASTYAFSLSSWKTVQDLVHIFMLS